MKKIIVFLILSFISFAFRAQDLVGAWESYSTSENGDNQRSVVIFADGYQVFTIYVAITGKFISNNGDTWKLDGDLMTEKVEFNTRNPGLVGTEVSLRVIITENDIEIVDSHKKLKRFDKRMPGKSQCAWLIYGRIRDGET